MARPKKDAPLNIPGLARKPEPQAVVETVADLPDIAAGATRATINLTVTDELKWTYKEWCTRHRMSQVDAFKEAFELLQAKHGR
jgi:hypothetical protein